MLIVCPTCTTSYQVQPASLGTGGRSVRCSHCKNTWFATADSVAERALVALPALAHDPAPVPAPSTLPQPAGGFAEAPAEGATGAADVAHPAESETALAVADAPPLVPQDHPVEAEPSPHRFDPGVPDQGETIAARRARHAEVDRKNRPSLLRRLASLPMLIFVFFAILAVALHWRVPVVRHFPQTASLFSAIGLPVNLRGLIFEDVKSTSEMHDGVTVLVIEGTIVNLTRRTLEVPRLRFTLRNSAGHEVYAWNALPSKTTLGSGNELPFRARLASPPPDGRDVIVRFFNRRDVSAGSP